MPELAPVIWQLAVAVSVLLMVVLIISGSWRAPRGGKRAAIGDLTVCLLCRDQEAELEYMVRRMLAVLEHDAGHRRIQLVIVDADSSDETPCIAHRLGRASPAVRAMTGPAGWTRHLLNLHRRGCGSAVLAFWPRSTQDWERAVEWIETLACSHRRESDRKWKCAGDR